MAVPPSHPGPLRCDGCGGSLTVDVLQAALPVSSAPVHTISPPRATATIRCLQCGRNCSTLVTVHQAVEGRD